eukprot:1158545-Pelagomonas_calceolata.AAC.5
MVWKHHYWREELTVRSSLSAQKQAQARDIELKHSPSRSSQSSKACLWEKVKRARVMVASCCPIWSKLWARASQIVGSL